jgi:AcrR family transcriptional regulator
MGGEKVARNQRTRLFGAMIESVSRRGYHATTVAHVVALAGVSRRAFYEQFSDKEDCFLATHDIVVARARQGVLDASRLQSGWAEGLHAGCEALLGDIAASPEGPRLVLVDSLGIGPRARVRMQLASLTFERLVACASQLAPGGAGFPPLGPRAVVGGVRHVLFIRMLERREWEPCTLTDELLDWISSYRIPAAVRPGALGLATPPRLPPAPAAFLAREDGRARALGSLVQLTLEEGYSRLSDQQIAQFAGISTEAFHKQFPSKEECLLAVLDEFFQEALRAVSGRLENADSWPQGVHLAMAAFLDHLAAHEALLRIAFINLFEVGPNMIGRMTTSVESLTKLLTEHGPPPRHGPRLTLEAVTGAVWAIIFGYVAHISSDRLSRLPCLVDHLTFTVLAPYTGPRAAVEAIQAARRSPRSV